MAMGVALAILPLRAQTLQGHDFRLQVGESFKGGRVELAPRKTIDDVGTDIPYDVAPAHARFTFPIGDQGATVDVIPLKDASVKNFAEAYPDLDSTAKDVQKLLDLGQLSQGKDLPVWNCPDAEQTIHARARILETPWCKGIQFITRYTQEAGAPIDNSALMYTFQGLSRDGRYFIAIDIPLTQAALPLHGVDYAEQPGAKIRAYYRQMEKQLNEASEDSFKPSLKAVNVLIQSLQPIASKP